MLVWGGWGEESKWESVLVVVRYGGCKAMTDLEYSRQESLL